MISPSRLFLLLVIFGVVSACSNQQQTPPPLSLATLMDTGKIEFLLQPNQKIIINPTQDQPGWQVTLGRRDFEAATFALFDDKTQNTVEFSVSGRYNITVSSKRSGGAPNVMQHTLTAIVE